MDESLGRACCAGGEDDERRILEFNADWRWRWLVGAGLDEVFESLCLGNGLCIVGFGKALDNDKRLQLVAFRHAVDHALNVVSQINDLAVVQGAIIKEDKLDSKQEHISLISSLLSHSISSHDISLTFGFTCTALCNSPPTPMSVELLLNMPPSHVVARYTTYVLSEWPATITTRSPFFRPLSFSAAASVATSLRSSRHVMCRTSVFPSRTSVNAILASSLCSVLRTAADGDEESRV